MEAILPYTTALGIAIVGGFAVALIISSNRPNRKAFAMQETIAVEAGGCAPPIIVPLSQREIDLAYVDAGIMPLAEYIALYGAAEAHGG